MRYKRWGNTFPNLSAMVDLGELSRLVSNPVVIPFQVKERAARERSFGLQNTFHQMPSFTLSIALVNSMDSRESIRFQHDLGEFHFLRQQNALLNSIKFFSFLNLGFRKEKKIMYSFENFSSPIVLKRKCLLKKDHSDRGRIYLFFFIYKNYNNASFNNNKKCSKLLRCKILKKFSRIL